jgi:hypothetical protein
MQKTVDIGCKRGSERRTSLRLSGGSDWGVGLDVRKRAAEGVSNIRVEIALYVGRDLCITADSRMWDGTVQ